MREEGLWPGFLPPTSKNVAALFMRREEKLSEEQKEYLKRLCRADEALADARRLTQAFNGMVRNLEGGKLDGWLGEAEACGATAMRRFTAGLRRDLPAVRAGLTEEWSNGPVEGFVHKLKLLKRQGYGRAGFDLLRARMLVAQRPLGRRSKRGRVASPRTRQSPRLLAVRRWSWRLRRVRRPA